MESRSKNPTAHRLFRIAERTIAAYGMFRQGDSVLVGLSGGPDSVALLHVLLEMAPRFDLRLAAAHLNHCLRGKDADADAEFAASLAKKHNMPYYMDKTDVGRYQHEHGLSTEEAARNVRYDFYERIARTGGFGKIALAHHADDNAELVLMYLFRGSGLTGMSGIPPVREGKFVRPFIHAEKADILDFLATKGIPSVRDKSNQDTRYLRNRIRHELLPMLRASYSSGISRNLNRFSLIAKAEDEWIESLAEEMFQECLVGECEGDEIVLSVPALRSTHTVPRRRVIRKAIRQIKGDLRRITYVHTEAVRNLSESLSERADLDLPNRVRVRKNGEKLIFSKTPKSEKGKTSPPFFEYEMQTPGILFMKEVGAYLKLSVISMKNLSDAFISDTNTAHFDMGKLSFPMRVRNFRPGDRFHPLGAKGTQKLKKYFINSKIPREERAECPLLVCGERIVWVAGRRTDETAKITPLTRNVLKAEFFPE